MFVAMRGFLIVIPAREYSDIDVVHLINDAVFLIDSARPTSGQLVFQRLRLALPNKRVALNFEEKIDDALRHPAVA
jgi:hypothetical protein